MNLAQRLGEMDRNRPKSILVIGDGMTDVYVSIRVDETCQEGCPKYTKEREVVVDGGARNAARSLHHWTSNITCITSRYGPIKTRFMIKSDTVVRYPPAPVRDTNVFHTIEKCVLRYDDDGDSSYSSIARIKAADTITSPTAPVWHAVLLSDYDKGILTPEFIVEVSSKCAKLGIPCVADCKRDPKLYADCILKCNSDYQHKYNMELSGLVYDADVGRRLVCTSGAANPIIWDGAGPMGLGYDLPRVECVNHVGAGDCFAAHLTLALAHGYSLKDAAAVAHSASRVYVQHPYNRPPPPSDVVADMELRSN